MHVCVDEWTGRALKENSHVRMGGGRPRKDSGK